MSSHQSVEALNELVPEPLVVDNVARRNSDIEKLNEIKQHRFPALVPALLKMQKYSSVTFTVFAFLHGSAVVVSPLMSVGVADEVLDMTRTVYQAPGLETLMVWGSLAVHVASGVVLRLLRAYRRRQTGPRSTPRKPDYADDSNGKELAPEYGLGGVTSILGLGAKRSLVSRKLGLSPLSFSGYVLVVFLAGHVYKERIVPLLVDGDSSFVDLSFVAHALNGDSRAVTAISLATLVLLSSYHIISGWMRYLHIRSRRSRKAAYAVITGLTLAGAVSLNNVARMGASVGFLAAKFDSYIRY